MFSRLFIVFIVLIFAFWLYKDAKKRDGLPLAPLIWLGLALFFPLVIIPFYLLIIFQKKFKSKKTVSAQPQSLCPKCGESVSKSAKRCTSCNNKLSLSE